jgi:hypothetical protein
VGHLLITFEWSDWWNRMVWWIASGSGGLRLYVDATNIRAQKVYAALGMNGDHYRVFEDMFAEPLRSADIQALWIDE